MFIQVRVATSISAMRASVEQKAVTFSVPVPEETGRAIQEAIDTLPNGLPREHMTITLELFSTDAEPIRSHVINT